LKQIFEKELRINEFQVAKWRITFAHPHRINIIKGSLITNIFNCTKDWFRLSAWQWVQQLGQAWLERLSALELVMVELAM
jgi:hypothetical protein